MKTFLLGAIMLFAFTSTFAQVEGTWKMSPQAAALGVGPSLGDISWWSNSAGDVITRGCYFDDKYVFEEDGTFSNVLDGETWIEPWQGMDPEACGTPVAPHDGSNAATWTYDDVAGTITLTGVGAYIGLPKVINEGEISDPADAPASITYPVEFNADADTMTINISIGTGYWRFILTTNAGDPPPADIVTLPVTFEDEDLNYSLTDFGGTNSTIITDPSNSENHVVHTIRGEGAETWAGTTVAEPFGLEPAVPFEEGSTIMTMRVFSPEADLPILFKLEVWDNTSTSVETISNTTVVNEWETISFDFSNEVEGTQPLDFANPYNKIVVFFNFGTSGADAGEQTFYWDDIEFEGGDEPKPLLALDVQDNFEGDGWGTITSWKFQDAPELIDLLVVPDPTDPENHIAAYVRSGTFQYTNAQFVLDHRMDLSERNTFELKVALPSTNDYSGDLATTVAMKLQNSLLGGDAWTTQTEVVLDVEEFDAFVTLTFDFSAAADIEDYDQVVVQIGGEGHFAPGLFSFDDLELLDEGTKIETNLQKLEFVVNPVQDVLYLKNIENVKTIYVYSLLGQSYEVEKIGENRYDFSGLSTGIYTVLVRDEEGNSLVGKVLKQ